MLLLYSLLIKSQIIAYFFSFHYNTISMVWKYGFIASDTFCLRWKRGDEYVQKDDPNFDDYFINNSNFESNQELPY